MLTRRQKALQEQQIPSNDSKALKEQEPTNNNMSSMVSMKQVRELAAKGRVAMVIDGVAWDFTEFAPDHPGGPDYLRKNKGKVATEEFVASHPVDIIERTLTSEQFDEDGTGKGTSMRLGLVDPTSILPSDIAEYKGHHGAESKVVVPTGSKPSIDGCINVCDFEAIARVTVPEQGWVYYSSGADDEITLRENHSAFQRIWMRPRVLVDVKQVDTSTTIMGKPCSMPLMLCAVAMCKLGHPDGEVAWNKAAGAEGVIYMIPTLSGCKFDDITGAAKPNQPMYFQLYVNQDRSKTKKIVQKAEAAGCSALFITVDAPQLGNREKDRRVKVSHSGAAVQSGGTKVKKSEGTAKALTTFIDPSLCWADLDWFASITSMKICLKGIATAEDAVMALENGNVASIMLSNHGGRQLDGARSAIEILPEVMAALRAHPKYDNDKFEVYIDGGIRRGTDIYKALALGATAVGIGRPALYAMSAFGEEGVRKCIQIFRDELEMTMRLMGTQTLADIKETSVITSDLATHITPVPVDSNAIRTYQPKVTQALKAGFLQDPVFPPALGSATPNATPTKELTGKQEVTQIDTLVSLVKVMLLTLANSVFATTLAGALHKSAVLLVAYLVIHVLGVSAVFLGKDTFNAYGHRLRHNPIIVAVEYYLLIGALVHAVVALYMTYKKRKFIMGKLATNGRLFLSSILITVFVVLHVLTFRFGPEVSPISNSSYVLEGGVHDLYGMAEDLFLDWKQVVFYVAAVGAVGMHMYIGWTKTVNKFDVSKDTKAAFIDLGHALVYPVCVGFAIVPCYFYYKTIVA